MVENKRRYLDLELENEKLTASHMNEIRKRLFEEYKIEAKRLKKEDESNQIWEDICSKIAEKCLENIDFQNIGLEKIEFQQMEFTKMGFAISQQQIIRNTESDNNKKNSENNNVSSNMDEKEVIKLYQKIIKPDEKCQYIVEISFDEWKQQMHYMLVLRKIFEMDFEMQNYVRLKYSMVCDHTYNGLTQKKSYQFNPYYRLSKEEYFPMKNPYKLPVFLKELQDVLFTQKNIRVFDFETFGKDIEKSKESEDISRYGYVNVEQIFEKLYDAEVHNFYYMDNMLGVSLTNTIFYYIIERKGNEWGSDEYDMVTIARDIFNDNLFSIMTMLGKLECMYGRNYIAQMTFNFLRQKNFDIGAIKEVFQYLKANTDRFNKYYRDLCDANIYGFFYDIDKWSENDKRQAIDEFEDEWKNIIESYIYDEGIINIMNKCGNGGRIKRNKNIKTPDVLYAQIHEAVMKGIWER